MATATLTTIAPTQAPAQPAALIPFPRDYRDAIRAGRIPPALAVQFDAYAQKAGITRSEAVRQLLERGLKAKTSKWTR